ncbi:hypothetical protein [Heyndrickxia camelliae]|uniref:hypothetical protein n=1 Tax=Heyndrickxia camelliae TaxID=1707093 RepID=UPI001A9C2BC6|nr:hypothetical protein [Heyndrickxia camelliae]
MLVSCHIGVHWQWIKGTCKKAFKFKTGEWKKGVIVSVIFSIAILAGGIQWFFSTSQPTAGDMKQFAQKSNSKFFNNGSPSTLGGHGGDFQGPLNGEFHKHDKEKFEHRGGASAYLVIFQYFGIFVIIIIPVYFIDKRFLSKRRTQKKLLLKDNAVYIKLKKKTFQYIFFFAMFFCLSLLLLFTLIFVDFPSELIK